MSSQKALLALLPFYTDPSSGSPSGPTSKTFGSSYAVGAAETGFQTEVIDVRGVQEITFHIKLTNGTPPADVLNFVILGNSYAGWSTTGDLKPITKTAADGVVTQVELSVDPADLAIDPTGSGILSFDIRVDCTALGVIALAGKSDGAHEGYCDASVRFVDGAEPQNAAGSANQFNAMRLGYISLA